MKSSIKIQSSNSSAKQSKTKRDSIQYNYDVFGKELKLLVEMRELPELIYMFGYIIKNYGVLLQGLFRVSGNKTRMDELRLLYSQTKQLEVEIDDIHNITGLFKTFLREIPGGIIPYPQSLDLMKATRMYKRNENLDQITNELLKLPVPHYNLLKYTCSLLSQVSLYSINNLMTPDNLGTVFGPTFFSSVEDVSLLQLANTASTILIQHYDNLFKVSAPVHTNFNQTTENIPSFDADPSNERLTSTMTDHITTIKFGESYLLLNLNDDAQKSLSSNSSQNQKLLPPPETSKNVTSNKVIPFHYQFYNSLDMNQMMRPANNSFSHLQDSEFANFDPIYAPHLINHGLLNQDLMNVHQTSDQRNYSDFKLHSNEIRGRKSFVEPYSLSLPGPEIHANDKSGCLNGNGNETNHLERTQEKFPHKSSGNSLNNNLEIGSYSNCKRDFSIFHDASKSKDANESKNKNDTPYNSRENSNVKYWKSERSETESLLSNVKRITEDDKLKPCLLENFHFNSNSNSSDKSQVHPNERYLQKIEESKHTQKENGDIINSRNIQAESFPNMNRNISNQGGKVEDRNSNFPTPHQHRLLQPRPLSSMSEFSPKRHPMERSQRNNTLRLIGNATTNLCPTDLNSVQYAVAKLHDDLKRERIQDNRPCDLNSMSQQQVYNEKIAIQKALLNFESIYGSNETYAATNLLRPLYDRYKQVKRLITVNLKQGQDGNESISTDNHCDPSSIDAPRMNGKPSSRVMYSLDRRRMSQYNNLSMFTQMVSEFEIDEEYISNGQPRSDSINEDGPISHSLLQRRNEHKSQCRRSSLDQFNDTNNNKKHHSRMGQLMSELRLLQVEKKDLQRLLKDFENKFEQDTKRKMEKSDRLPMEQEYIRYKAIKNRIKEYKTSLEDPTL